MMRVAALLCLITMPLGAQVLQGVVRDSVSRLAIPGAVVSVLDTDGITIARTLSDAKGAYRLVVRQGQFRIRLQRLGFRLRELPGSAVGEEPISLDFSMVAIPSLLESVRVMGAAKCPRRRDNADAFALLQQARAGLLNSVVAREANPANVVRYAFERLVTEYPDSSAPSIRIDSTAESTTSFRATMSGAEFSQFGFQRKSGDRWQYFGPDADVLLDEGFAAGYCFRIAERDRARANQIGLGFSAAGRAKGRVDIVGTLWIDTVARALRDIQYTYVGIGGLEDFIKSGGSTSFREMANGSVIIDRWAVRLLKTVMDSVRGRDDRVVLIPRLAQSEGGGFLAMARWPDGTTWTAPMGAARLQLMVNDSTPAVAAEVRLQNTDYRGMTDTSGRIALPDLFPGRYRVLVVDTLLASFGLELNPQFEFVVAANGVVETTARVRSTAEELLGRCKDRHPSRPADLALVVTVRGPSGGGGVPHVKVDFTVDTPDAEPRALTDNTGPNGTILLCLGRGDLGSTVQVIGSKGDRRASTGSHRIANRVTVFNLVLASPPSGAMARERKADDSRVATAADSCRWIRQRD